MWRCATAASWASAQQAKTCPAWGPADAGRPVSPDKVLMPGLVEGPLPSARRRHVEIRCTWACYDRRDGRDGQPVERVEELHGRGRRRACAEVPSRACRRARHRAADRVGLRSDLLRRPTHDASRTRGPRVAPSAPHRRHATPACHLMNVNTRDACASPSIDARYRYRRRGQVRGWNERSRAQWRALQNSAAMFPVHAPDRQRRSAPWGCPKTGVRMLRRRWPAMGRA